MGEVMPILMHQRGFLFDYSWVHWKVGKFGEWSIHSYRDKSMLGKVEEPWSISNFSNENRRFWIADPRELLKVHIHNLKRQNGLSICARLIHLTHWYPHETIIKVTCSCSYKVSLFCQRIKKGDNVKSRFQWSRRAQQRNTAPAKL